VGFPLPALPRARGREPHLKACCPATPPPKSPRTHGVRVLAVVDGLHLCET